jgi:hypothetical protein
MTARQRIESLTASWVTFIIVSGLATLLVNGVGVFSLLIALGSVVVNVAIVLFIGRRLLAGSSLTRTFLLVVATIGALGGSLAAAKFAWAGLWGFSFRMLVLAAIFAANAGMNVHSIRVLLSDSVKAHCR